MTALMIRLVSGLTTAMFGIIAGVMLLSYTLIPTPQLAYVGTVGFRNAALFLHDVRTQITHPVAPFDGLERLQNSGIALRWRSDGEALLWDERRNPTIGFPSGLAQANPRHWLPLEPLGSGLNPRWAMTASFEFDGPRALYYNGDRLMLYTPDAEPRPLLTHPSWTIVRQAGLGWHPDGDRVVLAADDGTGLSIGTVDVASGAFTPLRPAPPHLNTLEWAPDGERIFLSTRDPDTRDTTGAIYDLHSGETTELFTARLHRPFAWAWSWDGAWMAYATYTQINVLPTDGSAAPRLLHGQLANPHSMAWSPDGRWLSVFNSGDVLLLPTGGGPPRTLNLRGSLMYWIGWRP